MVAAMAVLAAESNARTVDEYTFANGKDIMDMNSGMHETLFM